MSLGALVRDLSWCGTPQPKPRRAPTVTTPPPPEQDPFSGWEIALLAAFVLVMSALVYQRATIPTPNPSPYEAQP